ncbi:hypothetical protein QCA50_004743 [Cerrena zonata]|uniref:Major facilitator superfamily (MFS) profile domain-containing protein n=1 Tax=Cerrena zonata TaxID=2478898 RepID=A0AAW0GN60_9APHY
MTSNNERQPLLQRSEDSDADQSTDTNGAEVPRTPLPKAQLATVFLIKLLLPVATLQTAPYINLKLEALPGISEENMGYYSGIVSTSFHLAQVLSVYPWARISDSAGRLPVLFAGTLGIAITTSLFGLSETFTGVLITRFLCGIFSGTTGAIHSIVGELTDSTNQGVAFPLYDIVAAVGFIVGPLMGGTLANPTKQSWWPWKESGSTLLPSHRINEWFNNYPFLLPCLVTSALAVFAVILGTIVLSETLPKKGKSRTVNDTYIQSQPTGPQQDDEIEESRPTVWTLIQSPLVFSVSLSSFALGAIAAAFNSVFVLDAYTSTKYGGLGLDPKRIGHALSLMGFISIFLKLSLTHIIKPYKAALLPNGPLEDRPAEIYIFAMRAWPVTFLGFILLRWIAQWTGNDIPNHDSGGISGLMWLAVSGVLFLSRVGCMGFTLMMIFAKDAAPSSTTLGAINGLIELTQAVGITITPVIISSLFAFSITHKVFGGYLWVFASVFISVLGALLARSSLQISTNCVPFSVPDPGVF